MDVYDKEILNIIQSSFPLDSRPYAIIGEQIGLSEDETLKRVNTLRETGVIRRLGGNFGVNWVGVPRFALLKCRKTNWTALYSKLLHTLGNDFRLWEQCKKICHSPA